MNHRNEKTRLIPFQDLTLLDRFLFSEAVEDEQFLADVLSIIMGEDIVLKNPPQTEKEMRSSEIRKYIKLDVFSEDLEENIYDTEVQKKNTGNLPRRSRYYQAMVDSKLLAVGDTDYQKLNRVHMIMIAPFDLFGKDRYRYTFQMSCIEEADVCLDDGAYRIFLNTHGKDDENISPELKALLQFFEHPSKEVAEQSGSERIKRMQKRVKTLKESEELGAKYMREWEEKALARKEGRAEGHAEGHAEGLEEGQTLGQARVNQLFAKLFALGRLEDAQRAATDPVFQAQLFAELGL